MDAEQALRKVFWYLNRYFMVPMFRLGLGGFIGNPVTGYILVLRHVGHKSGKTRYTPVNYAIRDGAVYCLAGFGKLSDWYKNIRANGTVEVIMPGGAFRGMVEEVTEPVERLEAIKRVLRNAGLAALFGGFNPFNPYHNSDEELEQKTAHYPVLRIRPVGVANGPADPGGWMGIIPFVLLFWWWTWRKK